MDKEIVRDTRPLTLLPLLPMELCTPTAPGYYLGAIYIQVSHPNQQALTIVSIRVDDKLVCWTSPIGKPMLRKIWFIPIRLQTFDEFEDYKDMYEADIRRAVTALINSGT
jgi:hypothetical protein